MIQKKKPAAKATTNDCLGSCVVVPTTPKRKVTYIFHTTTKKDLHLPYAVGLNGKQLKEFNDKPRKLRCNRGKIVITVDPGMKVALFLNSDAHPSYRKNPVYEITPTEKDVVVTITEKLGKHADPDTPVKSPENGNEDSKEDHYTAPLTGDIWKRVSHQYTADEAAALITAGTDPSIKDAVLSIYKGLTAKQIIVNFPAKEATKDAAASAALRVTANFADDGHDNTHANISGYDLLTDGLPRVHPMGYVELLNAAHYAGLTHLDISSGWRPMLGSIAHRAGLGLDVNYIEDKDKKTRLNRVELTDKKGPHTGNVSDEEKKLYKEYEDAKKETASSQVDLKAAQLALEKGKKDPSKVQELTARRDAAKGKLDQAIQNRDNSKDLWDAERNKNEPQSVRTFRDRLNRCPCVDQVLDPWYMNMDTHNHDTSHVTPNEQRKGGKKGNEPSNETIHANHLHITVDEPKIL